MPKKGQQYTTMTDELRLSLVQYKMSHPKTTQRELIKWLEVNYNLKVSQAAVSGTLKRTEELLAKDPDSNFNMKRQKPVKYPAMEAALAKWFSANQDHCSLGGKLIRETAMELLDRLYPDHPPFKFSNGWIDSFKARHDVAKLRRPSRKIKNEAPTSTGDVRVEPATQPSKKSNAISNCIAKENSTIAGCEAVQSENEGYILARRWAMKFNQLAPYQRLCAEKIINDTLFEAEMGSLKSSSSACFPTMESESSPSQSPTNDNAAYKKNTQNEMMDTTEDGNTQDSEYSDHSLNLSHIFAPSKQQRCRKKAPESDKTSSTIVKTHSSDLCKPTYYDDCDQYGKILVNKLRKLSETERHRFMSQIDGMFCSNISSTYNQTKY